MLGPGWSPGKIWVLVHLVEENNEYSGSSWLPKLCFVIIAYRITARPVEFILVSISFYGILMKIGYIFYFLGGKIGQNFSVRGGAPWRRV